MGATTVEKMNERIGNSVKSEKKEVKFRPQPKTWQEKILEPMKRYGKWLILGWVGYTWLKNTDFYTDWFGPDYKSMISQYVDVSAMTNSMARSKFQMLRYQAMQQVQG